MEKKIKELLKLTKKVAIKETYKKLINLEDGKEKDEAIKYTLITSLEREHRSINKKIKSLDTDQKDTFTAKNKATLLPSKIKHFEVEFNKDEFYKVYKLIKDIKKELKKI